LAESYWLAELTRWTTLAGVGVLALEQNDCLLQALLLDFIYMSRVDAIRAVQR